MPYVAPSTVVAGQTYSAAAHNVIVNDVIDHEARINQYAGVYTNEAARDAAITSPTEGMRVYLTAPTIPAATGGTTYIPTGITTVYNGSAWVCVTEVGAFTSTQGTTTSTSYTTSLSAGTNPTVTLVTGTTVVVSVYAHSFNNANNANCYLAVSVSGASTIAAADDNSAILGNATSGANTTFPLSRSFILGGLTAGTNTFALNYKVTSNTGTYQARTLTVKGIA